MTQEFRSTICSLFLPFSPTWLPVASGDRRESRALEGKGVVTQGVKKLKGRCRDCPGLANSLL